MKSFFLLRGIEFSLPPEAQGVIIGLFWGLVTGLFFYQSYRRPYFWWYSLLTGVLFATLAPRLLSKIGRIDSGAVEFVILQVLLPGIACLFLNILLSRSSKKHKKRKQRKISSMKKIDIFVEQSDQSKS